MTTRTGLRLLGFVLAFTLEVRVASASEPQVETSRLHNSKQVLQEPRNCIATLGARSQKSICAVKTASAEKFEIKVSKGVVVLDQETAVIVSNDEVTLVDGTLWIHAGAQISIRTEFGVAKVDGEAWVTRSPNRMSVSSVGGNVQLIPRGSVESLAIDSGLENFVGGVQKDGSSETGLPVAIPFADHLARWARLYPGTKAEFEEDVKRFHSTWVEASKQASEVHRTLLDRRVAGIEEQERQKAARRNKIELENRELRNLFRKKFFDSH
ncbi:MAG: hypothetical protein V4692_09335 [Bdellovibrionota bacterium]